MNARHLPYGSLLLLFLSVFACTEMKSKKSLPTLEPAVMQFYEQLKWFNGEISKEFVPPAFRSVYLDQLDTAEHRFSFNSIQIVRITPDKAAKKAVVRLRISWTAKDDNIVNDTLVETTWEHHGSSWYHIRGRVVDGPKIPVLFEK